MSYPYGKRDGVQSRLEVAHPLSSLHDALQGFASSCVTGRLRADTKLFTFLPLTSGAQKKGQHAN